MAISLPAEDFEYFAESGRLFQLKHKAKLMTREHYHDYYEMLTVLSGKCKHRINGKEYIQKAGDSVILRPGDRHCFSGQSADISVSALSVFRDVFDGLAREFMLTELIHAEDFISIGMTHEELDAHKRLCEQTWTLAPLERAPLCQVLLGHVFSVILMRRSRPEISDKGIPESLAKAISEMSRPENIAEGVPALLRLSSFSHTQLCRLTKKHLGKTPSEYVKEVRMKYAWELAAYSDMPLVLVGEAVGYGSYSQFCTVFKEAYGKTPSQARHYGRTLPTTI